MQKHFSYTILVSALGLVWPAFSWANGGEAMDNCRMGLGMIAGGWFGLGIFGWVLMVLFWVLAVLGVVFLVKWALEQGRKR